MSSTRIWPLQQQMPGPYQSFISPSVVPPGSVSIKWPLGGMSLTTVTSYRHHLTMALSPHTYQGDTSNLLPGELLGLLAFRPLVLHDGFSETDGEQNFSGSPSDFLFTDNYYTFSSVPTTITAMNWVLTTYNSSSPWIPRYPEYKSRFTRMTEKFHYCSVNKTLIK